MASAYPSLQTAVNRGLLRAGIASMAIAALLLSRLALAGGESVVKIDNFSFRRDTVNVPIGTTLIWRNGDDIPHSVVAADKSFHSRALDSDEQFSFVFEKPGEFVYFCGLHPFMKGKIIVTP
jgi:plastocyanin